MTGAAEIELPLGFEALRPFSDWALLTESERMLKRADALQGDIVRFRDAMIERVESVVEHLNTFPLDAMPTPERNLMAMLLSLAEIAPAVEFYHQPNVIDGFDPRRFLPDEDFILRPNV